MTGFVFGAIGAMAPEVLRWYDVRHQPFRVPLHYWIASALYIGLGGTVAVILAAPNPYTAFYIGVTLPLTIGAIARRSGDFESGDPSHRVDHDSVQVEEVDPIDGHGHRLTFRQFVKLV